MRLKSLELVGFKSFLDHTIIGFSPGMTAVVGPNGCGKSNVVDAIRWVLGEQAPTRLRGKSVEDLIYAGNDSNPAAGMAEVSLVLEAEEGSLLPEPYSTLSEIAVTRRAYRSGDSEYLLNKIPCRLKDITEFFMAAQIHSRGYSIVEQGRIEEVIQAKPHEVRGLIEEAAGLSLFKGRREMGERKLERVKENLARLDDVLSEIERQLNYARRQAKKAETYKIVKAEFSELERYAAARRLIEQREELAIQTDRDAELRAQSESTRHAADNVQSAAEGAGIAAQSARAELGGAKRELQNLEQSAAERARSREFLKRRLEAINQLEPEMVDRLADLELKATSARAARALAASTLARELYDGDGDIEAVLDDLTARHQSAHSELKQAERKTEEVKDELSDVIREAAVIRGRLGDLAGERAELEERLAALEQEAPALAAEMETARSLAASADAELEACRVESASLEEVHREASACEMEIRTTVEHLAGRIVVLKGALETRTNGNGAAATDGARLRLRTILESLNGDRPSVDPVLLNQVVRAPLGLEPALKAVLGDELEAVVVESPAFAVRAIEILKENRAGRLSFLQQPDADVAAHASIDAPGIAGRLIDMVEVDQRFALLAEAMLGHVIVADDLRAALAASNLNGHGSVFVTREGDLVHPGRMISGGSTEEEAHAAADLAAAARQAEELARTEEEHQSSAAAFNDAHAAKEQAHQSLNDVRQRGREIERIVGERRAALNGREQSKALADAQLGGARRRLGEIGELAASANARLEQLAVGEQELRSRLASLGAELASCRAAAEDLARRRMEVAARVETRKAELAALEAEFRHAESAAKDIETQIIERMRALERARAERIEFAAELDKLSAQDVAAGEREAELALELERLGAECEARENELEEQRAELKQIRERLTALEAEANQCALRRERARTLSVELARSFVEKFGAEFNTVAADIIPALDGRDAAADDARIAALRGKLERIGEVNLAAESEVKELEERASTLGAERADLKTALDDLSKTIATLNREARKRFAATFEGAAKNFEELFPKLLRGGKGRLELTEATDVLEAGVNILVQPAAKKVKEIGLLSGGEKALSAMALIFSLFLLNPSPFCVMDEVDAPLDEFSLAAFVSLMSELKDRSQFIVITHNQRTMQRADQIHGVTMDRPGVSRTISLKIPQAA